MAKKSFTRREFLKVSALSTCAWSLGSCASMDHFFLGDIRNLSDEVAILGAGAAGLAAAYELKKKKRPYRVFEASSRIGGRIQSVSLFPDEGPIADLGAEFLEEEHQSVLNLARELNLSLQELKTPTGLEMHIFSFAGKVYRVKDIAGRMKNLETVFANVYQDLFQDQEISLTYKDSAEYSRSTYYDNLSLKDLLVSWEKDLDPLILKLIETQAVARFGVEADQQSALHFLSTFNAQGSTLLSGRKTFRMQGGMSNFASTLYQRVAGVIPQYLVKTEHALQKISEKNGIFEMTFATPQGRQVYTAKNVICTIPFSKLREVKGVADLQFSSLKKEIIAKQKYASHSKGALAFKDSFWYSKSANLPGNLPPNLGNFTGDYITQKFWDSGRGQDKKQGLLAFQRAGIWGEGAGESAVQSALKDLAIFYPQLGANSLLNSQMINWKRRPWSLGSMAYFEKGQYMRFKGVHSEPEYQGRFQFAGEHTSLKYSGTVNGAVESGLAAAAAFS